MKIMTLNTHSYIEAESERKLALLINMLMRIRPDVIALQEVNQTKASPSAKVNKEIALQSFGIELKADNYGLRIAEKLLKNGIRYNLVWAGIKDSYDSYEEGLCFLTKAPVTRAEAFVISKVDSDSDWRKRMALGIEIGYEWFYNVHMGRWDDEKEPFYNQWIRLKQRVNYMSPAWLMGDFNAPSDRRSEGYDCIISSGWHDTFMLAENKDSGFTVTEKIDGWHDAPYPFENKRIDYIFTDIKKKIFSSYTAFNGTDEEKISDHHAVVVTYEREM